MAAPPPDRPTSLARPSRDARCIALGRASVPSVEPPAATASAAPSAPTTAPIPGYLPGLDGLRAVAVFAVVAYHLGELQGGFLGVDVFFVISGFLITRLLLAERERTGRVALGAFWVRRFKRLLPALMVVLVAVAIASRAWLPSWRLGDIRTDALSALGYVANWRFVLSGQSYFESGVVPSPLRHTWSLAIEEQFYVLWPLIVLAVIALARAGSRRAVGIVSAVGAIASAATMAFAAGAGWDLSRVYYGTDTRAFALFAGAWLAAWWDPARIRAGAMTDAAGGGDRAARRWAVAAGVGSAACGAMFVLGSTEDVAFYRGGFQAMAVLSVVVVAGVATGRGPLVAALAWKPMVWLGRRSYGIYLWSWPVQIFAAEQFRLTSAALNATVVVVSVAAAALSHWLIEEPIRTGTRPAGFPPRAEQAAGPRLRLPRPAWSALGVVAVVGIVVGTAVGAPPPPEYTEVSDAEAVAAALGPISEEEAAQLRAAAGSTTTVPIEPDAPEPPVNDDPGPFTGSATVVVRPDAAADPVERFGRPMRVMIAGDSVGWSLGWALGREEPPLTDAVVVDGAALIGCGVMPRTSSFVIGSREPEQYGELCENADLAEFRALTSGPDVALLWLGAWEVYDHVVDGELLELGTDEYARFLEARIQQRVDRFKAVEVPTVMPLVPCFAPNAARLGNERQRVDRLQWVNARLRAVARRNPGWVRLIDPSGQVCDDRGRAVLSTPEGIPLREDGSHFDPPAAVWFWNTWLAGQMAAAFDVPAAGSGSVARGD